MKSLDRKLAAIHADPSGSKEFIIADAKDADMAFGIGAPGKSPENHAGEVRLRTLAEYREQIRQVVEQGIVDIMLMSASTNDILNIQERLFENSLITPAAPSQRHQRCVRRSRRDVSAGAVAAIPQCHARSHSVRPRRLRAGRAGPRRRPGIIQRHIQQSARRRLASVGRVQGFSREAERKGFRHFLEVFDPNVPAGLSSEDLPKFINDSIVRTLAGVAQAGRPVFLKVVYHGPRAMEELVTYDPQLIVGILGGGAGTTYDAFKLISEAQKYGARVALYGRKINNAENQLAFVEFLRLIVDGVISPEEAVGAYHGVLARLKIKPQRRLEDDLVLQTGVMSYGGSSSASVPAGMPIRSDAKASAPKAGPAHHCSCHDHAPAKTSSAKTDSDSSTAKSADCALPLEADDSFISLVTTARFQPHEPVRETGLQ